MPTYGDGVVGSEPWELRMVAVARGEVVRAEQARERAVAAWEEAVVAARAAGFTVAEIAEASGVIPPVVSRAWARRRSAG